MRLIPIAPSEAPSMSCPARASTKSIRHTSCKNPSRRAGAHHVSQQYRAPHGRLALDGKRNVERCRQQERLLHRQHRAERAASLHSGLLAAAPRLLHQRRPPRAGRRTSAIGRAIPISQASSRARATRCTRNGSSWTCVPKSQLAPSRSHGPVRTPRAIRWNTGSEKTRSISTAAREGEWKTFPSGIDKERHRAASSTLKLAEAPVSTRFLRVLMTESSNTCDVHGSDDVRNCVGYAIQEIHAGTSMRAAPSSIANTYR